MKISCPPVFVLFCALAWSTCLRGAEPATPATPVVPVTPVSLAVQANQEAVLTLMAKGVQIYECRPLAGEPGKFEWTFKAPEADLFDAQGHKVGRHYAGPAWELTDGSKVIGKVKAKVEAPDGRGVPWLLLDAVAHEGGGGMSKVQSIQRVATVGGQAPAEHPDQSRAGQERRVEYTATYVFYAAKH